MNLLANIHKSDPNRTVDSLLICGSCQPRRTCFRCRRAARREKQKSMPVVAWRVEVDGKRGIVFRKSAPAARWAGVKAFRERAYLHGEPWPTVTAWRAPEYDTRAPHHTHGLLVSEEYV